MAIYIDRNKPSSGLANLLAAKGRHGDTELVHMTKPEIQRLRNTGLMTLNPKTGLPEMWLGDIFKGIKTYAKNFLKPKNLVPTLAGIAGGMFLGPMIGNAAPWLRSFAPSIGKAAGILGGGVLTGRPVDEAAQSAVTAGVLDYGMSKIGDMFRPGPAAYGLDRGTKRYDTHVGQKLDSMYGAGVDIPEFDSDLFSSMDIESGATVDGAMITDELFYDDLTPSRTDVNRQIAALNKRNVPYAKWNTDNLTGEKLGRKFSRASPQMQKRLGGQQGDVRKLRAFIEGAEATDAGPFEFGRLGPDANARDALARQWAIENKTILTPETRAQGLDPWGNVKDIVSSADGLSSIDIKKLAKAIPVVELLSDIGTTQEALGITDMLAEQEKLTEEEMKGLTQLARRGTYTPTSNKIYRTPTKNIPIKFPRMADKGGLVSLAHGGDMRKDFEGLVQGRGHGMQDNVIMDIKQKGGLLAVSPKEYVVPADIMSGLGNGNPDAGAEHMDKFISDFRKKKYGRDKQPPEMDGGTALQSLMA